MATRNSWNIYEHSSGDEYIADGTIYVPNSDLPMGKSSRLQSVVLADGSIGTMIPSTKYFNNILNLTWQNIDDADAIIDKIETYVENATYIKITTTLAEDLIGTFIDISKTHLVGMDDTFDITATFLRH